MKLKASLLFLTFILSLGIYSQNSLIGLWEVKSVEVGNKEVTPNARWMRFHADGNQESGNGWTQHSIGTYSFNEKENELSMINTNGLLDEYGAFKVEINNESMKWTREEDGMLVTVNLIKTEKLPLAYGDQLLGLWKLVSIEGDQDLFQEELDPCLFIRWDKRFDIRSKEGRLRGYYQVNGHAAELNLIPFDEKQERSRWTIEYLEDGIILSRKTEQAESKATFKRIFEFPVY